MQYPRVTTRAWCWLALALLVPLAGCARFVGAGGEGNGSASEAGARPAVGRLLAVMVENSPAARPQSGLHRADVVFEALVEGGVTRFLAIFAHDDAPVIGPVRSARPYFVHLARPFDPLYVHCGQSASSVEAYRRVGIAHLDELRHGEPFRREPHRRAPHNLYTSAAALSRYGAALGYQREPAELPFPEGDFPEAAPAAGVEVSYPRNGRYTVGWRYDEAANLYRRYVNGEPHRDAETGEPIVAATVYVLGMPTRPFLASTGEVEIVTYGAGPAWALRNGRGAVGSWVRSAYDSPFVLFDTEGRTLAAAPGPVWVQIIPEGEYPTVLAPPPAGG